MFIKRLKISFRPLTTVAVITMTLTTQTIAQSGNTVVPAYEDVATQASFVEESGGGQRVNFSGKLRMLSQRIPAAACNLHAGIAMDQSAAVLSAAVAEFDRILIALEFGDDELGVYGPEERRRTLRVIEEVRAKLDPIHVALDNSVNGVPTDVSIQTIIDSNMALLEMAKLLVVEISGEYSSPVALMQSDALAIDIAGRQRMLTQKMSKEVCQVMSDLSGTAALETLGGTFNTFEVSLDALRNGMDQVGLQPAPNDEIAAGLDQVKADFSEVRGFIQTVAQGDIISDEQRAQVFTGLNTTMANMNRVVGMYSEASKLGL